MNWRRWLVVAALLLLLIIAEIFAFGPGMIERLFNDVAPGPAQPVSVEAQTLHRRLVIADMHADSLLWDRDLSQAGTRGQVDGPRLRAGNVALQIFSSVTKVPWGQNYGSNGADSDRITPLMIVELAPLRTWGLFGGHSLLARSLWHAERLKAMVVRSGGRLRLITSAAGLDRLLADRGSGDPVVGTMLSVEGLQAIEGKLGNLDTLHAAGFRMAGLAHFFDNDVAGSMHGLKKGGLTPLGRQVVRHMEEIGMIVDVAHASHATVAQVLAVARRPVVSSHGGVQATCKVNRNLTDEEVRGIARTGGVVGIGYWEDAVCGTDPAAIARAIAHVRDIAGIDHVGLGSDFDGAVTTPFDAAGLVALTQALLDRHFSPDDIAKVMGGNVLRVLRAGIVPMDKNSPSPSGEGSGGGGDAQHRSRSENARRPAPPQPLA